MPPEIDFAAILPEVAAKLKGEPNRALSTSDEIRYGSRGSFACSPKKGTWYDHEAGEGGGVLDLIASHLGLRGTAAIAWLEGERLIEARPPTNGSNGYARGNGAKKPAATEAPKPKIVETYDYVDEDGELVFQVVRLDPKDFRQRRPDGRGGWEWTIKGSRMVPYRLPELLARPEGAPVYVVEGEKDVDRLRSLGLCATTNAGGSGKWPDGMNEHFAGAEVVIIPDNDDPGRKHSARIAEALKGVAARVDIVTLPGLNPKGDVSDWLDAGGTVNNLAKMVEALKAPKKAPAPTRFTAGDLLGMEFPPITYVVDGYVVEGLTVLGGRPKLGKSWLALDFALAVAVGGAALGSIKCDQGDVLYLALEDNPRRLKDRVKQTLDAAYGGIEPQGLWDHLTFWTKAGRLDAGLMEEIDDWRSGCSQARMVIIDVLQKVRPQHGKNEGVYEYDYRCAAPLQQWAMEHGLAVVVVHHVRKAEATDPLEMLSGSNGLSGAADTILVLARDGNGVTLYGRGRDIEEVETAITRDSGAWRILGDAEEVRRSGERKAVLGLLRRSTVALNAGEVAAGVGIKPDYARRLLSRMAADGDIVREGYGRYSAPSS